jgi:ribosomal 50S subunit-associated protein YjgA (DUF615 family)
VTYFQLLTTIESMMVLAEEPIQQLRNRVCQREEDEDSEVDQPSREEMRREIEDNYRKDTEVSEACTESLRSIESQPLDSRCHAGSDCQPVLRAQGLR